MNTDAAIVALRADTLSGASTVSRTAADLLARCAEELPAASAAELAQALARICLRVLDAQPAMAPLVTLARDVLAGLDAEQSIEDVRRRAAEAGRGFAAGTKKRTASAGARASNLLASRQAVLTLSASSAVQAALEARAEAGDLHVFCLESRPMNEGRLLAASLARRGIRVTLAVDAALESLLDGCDAVLLGADSIGDRGVVNKIGSAGAAHGAVRRGIPVYVVADSSKLLPRGFPQPFSDDRPPEEVWSERASVHVWNRYFEAFPVALPTAVVTESADFAPEALERLREGLDVPLPLRAWAASRA